MLDCRRVVVALLLTTATAWATPPMTVPAERCTLQADGPDYLITCDLQATGNWEAYATIGWRGPSECLLVAITRSGARLYQAAGDGWQPVPASYHDDAAIPPGTAAELQILRRGAELTVSTRQTQSGQPMARAFLEGDLSGRAGVWAGEGVTLGEPMLQPLGEISFDEDFFEREQVPGRWQTVRGHWEVGVYYDPLQKRENFAPGACWYQSGEGECLATVGHWFWQGYRAEATVRLKAGAAGLACHVGEEGAAYGLVITGGGQAWLVRRLAGDWDCEAGLASLRSHTLAQAQAAAAAAGRSEGSGREAWAPLVGGSTDVRSGQWYRLALEVLPGALVGYVNGRQVGRAAIGPAEMGQVGLLALDAPGSEFDDVHVRAVRGASDAQSQVHAWAARGGQWQVGDDGRLTGRVSGGEVAALTAGEWTDCVVSAQVQATKGCTAGLVTHHEFGDRAYLFTITAGGKPTWHLHAVEGGRTEKLGEGPSPEPGGLLGLSWVGGCIEGSVNGRVLCRTYDFRAAPGRAGVYVGGGVASFGDYTCTEPERASERAICEDDGTGAKVPALQEKVFVGKIGGLWRRMSGAWSSGNTAVGPTITGTPSGGEARLRFHQVTPGDARVVADIMTPLQGGDFGIGLCTGETEGYRLRVLPGAGTAFLDRLGTTVAGAEGLQLAQDADTIELLRDGAWVVARLGRWQGIAFRDPDPLPSGQAEVLANGQPVRMARLTLTGEGALIYPFNRPEPDWVPASGTWAEHTGMACILWDYWLSGDARQQPALLWNRHPLGQDVTVDVEVSEYTEGHETGHHEHFPYHDAQIILGGRPDLPDRGYTFIIGADRGRRTVLLRDGVEVAASNDTRFRITMGGHCNDPRAVEVRASRQGSHLSLTLTGRVALQWDDPQPLPGGQVGLGLKGCRANFRECVIYPDLTWES